jgi:hypothetical protein
MVWTDHSIEIYFAFLSRLNLPQDPAPRVEVPMFTG